MANARGNEYGEYLIKIQNCSQELVVCFTLNNICEAVRKGLVLYPSFLALEAKICINSQSELIKIP